MNERLTLKQVSEILKVSTATISNAFNRPSQLSTELRSHILSECKKIGYLGPTASARTNRTNKTRVIGVMLSHQLSYSFSDPVANQMLQGLSQVFEEPEYNLLVMPSRRELNQLSGIESFVEGFIVYGPPAKDRLEELILHRKAIIAIDFEHEDITSINIDNQRASKDIANHAFAHKPQNVAILGLRICSDEEICTLDKSELLPAESNIMVQRLKGFQQAAIQNEIYIPDEMIWHVPDNNQAYAYHAARQMLNKDTKPEVILCMSDRCAISAARAVKDAGLRIPEDIMITGFDGIEAAALNNPTITTIAQASIDKGRIAAEIFLGLRNDESVVLNSPLRIGESCPATY